MENVDSGPGKSHSENQKMSLHFLKPDSKLLYLQGHTSG
jgi:hypothetical protein